MDKKTFEALRKAEAENNLREQLRLRQMGNQKVGFDPGTLFGTSLGNAALGTSFGVPNYAPNTILFHGTYEGLPTDYVKQAPDYGIMHETEHILDNRASGRYGEDWRKTDAFDAALQDAKSKGVGSKYSKDHWLEFQRNTAKPEVRERLKQLGANDGYLTNYTQGKTIGGKPTNDSPFDEIMASLSGLETAKGIDITKDPVLRKHLFNNNDAYIEAYKATTGLRTERLDAKDLPPYTAQNTLPPKKSIQERVMDVFFKDPFGDSTK